MEKTLKGFERAEKAGFDAEGAPDAAGVTIVGNEDEVTKQIRAIAAAGFTDFTAPPFPVADASSV